MSTPKKAALRAPGLCDDCVQWPAAWIVVNGDDTWEVCDKCRSQGLRTKSGFTYTRRPA